MGHGIPFEWAKERILSLIDQGALEEDTVTTTAFFLHEEQRCNAYLEEWKSRGQPMQRPKQGLDGRWTLAEDV